MVNLPGAPPPQTLARSPVERIVRPSGFVVGDAAGARALREPAPEEPVGAPVGPAPPGMAGMAEAGGSPSRAPAPHGARAAWTPSCAPEARSRGAPTPRRGRRPRRPRLGPAARAPLPELRPPLGVEQERGPLPEASERRVHGHGLDGAGILRPEAGILERAAGA